MLNEAESAHDPYAYFALSLFARHEGNYDKSVDLFLKAKNQKNYLAAQFEIAHDLIKGDFPFWDDRIAYDWINELAQVNYNPALLMLADLKESKKILAHTEQEIFLLRLKAAWQGSVKGQYLIGNMYLKGQAVLVEPVKAFRWFNAAARGGYRPAQLQIGLMYEQGAGMIQNRAKAYAWQKISTNQLYENSNEQLHQLALSMTQEELHEALRLEQLFKQNYTYYGYY